MIADEIATIEARLREAGRSIGDFCEAAGINQSTWTRWKSGKNAPNMVTWAKVREAMDRAANEQKGAA